MERQENEQRRLLIQKEEQLQQMIKRKNKQALLDDLVSNKTRGFECSVAEQTASTLTFISTTVNCVELTQLPLSVSLSCMFCVTVVSPVIHFSVTNDSGFGKLRTGGRVLLEFIDLVGVIVQNVQCWLKINFRKAFLTVSTQN